MSRGINKMFIVGQLGQDPELKPTSNNSAMATFSVATTDKWKDKVTGQWVEETEWHRCVAFGNVANIILQYARKGNKVHIEAKSKTRKYQDAAGKDQFSHSFEVKEFLILDKREPSAGAPQQQSNYQPQYNGQQQSAPQQHPQQHPQPAQNAAPAPAMDNFDDDIPF